MGIVLASRSPRRTDLLTAQGISFTVDPADIDESVHEGEKPHDYVGRMSASKHAVVSARHPHDTVVAADTIVPAEYAQLLYNAVGSKNKTIKIFSAEEGGSEHVQGDNRVLGSNYVADWLMDNL